MTPRTVFTRFGIRSCRRLSCTSSCFHSKLQTRNSQLTSLRIPNLRMIRHRQLSRQALDDGVVADERVADAGADDARLVADDRVTELGVLNRRPAPDRDV